MHNERAHSLHLLDLSRYWQERLDAWARKDAKNILDETLLWSWEGCIRYFESGKGVNQERISHQRWKEEIQPFCVVPYLRCTHSFNMYVYCMFMRTHKYSILFCKHFWFPVPEFSHCRYKSNILPQIQGLEMITFLLPWLSIFFFIANVTLQTTESQVSQNASQ